MKKKLICCLLACMSGSVFAGDMGAKEQDPSFDGLYLGLGAGFINLFTNDHWTTEVPPLADVRRYSDTAILFNGNLGYGKMFSEKTYLGGKAAIYYSPLQERRERNFAAPFASTIKLGNNTLDVALKPIYNIDGVLGYELFPRFLAFVEAGVSFVNPTLSNTFSRVVGPNLTSTIPIKTVSSLKLDSYKTTYNVGVGFNYLLHQNFFLSLEALYNDLGSKSGSASNTLGNTGLVEKRTKNFNSNAVAMFASASYLFNI